MNTLEINKIYNDDCRNTIAILPKNSIDVILTSPPYNTSRSGSTDKYNSRYDVFSDTKTDIDYINWTIDIFRGFDSILKQNGTVLYNISYSSENTSLIWLLISDIIRQTNFTTADCIVWKKKSAIPNNRSANKLTRICEYVFVFCRKTEIDTFFCNKSVISKIEKTGQNNYENVFNFIEAPNNDANTDINKATFSTDFVRRLLSIYAKKGAIVYDSFMGTGTTAEACIIEGMNYIGSEISEQQVNYANSRLNIRASAPMLFF